MKDICMVKVYLPTVLKVEAAGGSCPIHVIRPGCKGISSAASGGSLAESCTEVRLRLQYF